MFKYLKNVFVVFNISMSLLSIGLYAEQIEPTKQEMWDTMSDEVNHWIDGAGCPVDKEIKDTVIVLNLLGIETTASCEGHLDEEGYPYPWINIQTWTPEAIKMDQESAVLQEQISNELILLKTKYTDLSLNEIYDTPEAENLRNLNDKRWFIENSITQIQVKCLEPLNQLLNQFYENHTTSYENTLIIPSYSFGRLQSIGADRQHIRSREQQLRYLNEYQEEMKAFTIFLKQKFMN